jgi:hypothetical protein
MLGLSGRTGAEFEEEMRWRKKTHVRTEASIAFNVARTWNFCRHLMVNMSKWLQLIYSPIAGDL